MHPILSRPFLFHQHSYSLTLYTYRFLIGHNAFPSFVNTLSLFFQPGFLSLIPKRFPVLAVIAVFNSLSSCFSFSLLLFSSHLSPPFFYHIFLIFPSCFFFTLLIFHPDFFSLYSSFSYLSGLCLLFFIYIYYLSPPLNPLFHSRLHSFSRPHPTSVICSCQKV